MEITWSDVQTLICVRGDLTKWLEGLLCYPTYDDPELGYSEEEWYSFMKSCLEFDPVWASEILSSDLPPIAGKGERRIDTIVQPERLRVWQKNQLLMLKEECRVRVVDYKEDLIAVTWHPTRFSKWCLDWEERRELKKVWTDFQ